MRTATDVSSVIGVEGSDRYRIGLGVYGAEYPSIYQDETWIWVACFSQPGVSKVGWTLIRVDIRLYRNGRMVLDTADKGLSLDETNGSTVCDIGKGVDASFFDIDRSLVFDQWEVYVTNAEKNEENLTTGAVIRPRIDPRSCNVSENCPSVDGDLRVPNPPVRALSDAGLM